MNALQLLGLYDTKVYSVDLNKEYYRNTSNSTGYMLDELGNSLQNRYNHKFYFGSTIAARINEIGKDIDFVVIDTTHCLPGEILDFLVILPYLEKNAVIVLHDINLHYPAILIDSFGVPIDSFNIDKGSIATKVLFQTVVGNKFISFDIESANIAAFQINADTHKYIADVFVSLTMPWSYLLDRVLLEEYRNAISKSYEDTHLAIFDAAVRMNEKSGKLYAKGFINSIKSLGDKELYFYGAGEMAKHLYHFFLNNKINISGFVVTDRHNDSDYLYGKPIIDVNEFKGKCNDQMLVILASNRSDVKRSVIDNQIAYIIPDEIVFSFISKIV